MKYSPRFTYTFTPASNTLDLSSANNTGFSIRGLLAVIDADKNVLIYAQSSTGLGYSSISGGNVLTLQYNCASLAATDNLIFFYDDGASSSVELDVVATGTISATDTVVPAPSGSGQFVTGTPTANSYVTISLPGGDSSWSVQVTGLTSGTLYFEGSLDSTTGTDGNWVAMNGRPNGIVNTTLSISATTNGMFRGNAAGLRYFRVRSSGTLSGTPAIYIRVSDGHGAVFLNAGLPPGTDNIGNVGLFASSNAITGRADGFLHAQIDPTTLLYDSFDNINTTDTWTISGTVPPTGSGGVLSVAPGATASATSYAVSKPTFVPGSSAYTIFACIIQVEAATLTNTSRWWGFGTVTTPTQAVPVTNGTIFQIDTDGNLYGRIYSAGAQTQTVSLTRPTDGAYHRYSITYKASRVYFEIDNVVVASLAFPNPAVSALSTLIGSINGATAPTTAPVLNSSLMGVGDSGRLATKIADGTFPWRMQTIKAASTASAATDLPAVVALHPSSPLPAGTNTIGSVIAGNDGYSPPGSPYSTTTAGTIYSFDSSGYSYIDLNVTAIASGGGIQVQGMNATGTWDTSGLPHYYIPNIASNGPLNFSSVPATGLIRVPVGYKQMRIQHIGTPSGTTTLSITLRSIAWAAPSVNINGSATIVGTTATGAAPGTNYPVYTAGIDPSGNVRPILTGAGGSVTIQGAPQTTFSGTITTATSVVGGTQDLSTAGNCTVAIAGTYAGVTVVFEGSTDGTNYYGLQGQRTDSGNSENTSGILAANTVRAWNFSLMGLIRFRVRATSWTSGSATVTVDPGSGWFVPVVSAVVQQPIRTSFKLYAEAVTGSTTEALFSLISSTGFGTVATATGSFTTPNTRTYRITQLSLTVVATTATVASTRVRMRVLPTTTAVTATTGNVQWSSRLGFTTASVAIGQSNTQVFMFPDGIDIPPQYSFGFSHVESAASLSVDLDVVGYYY